MVNKLIVACLFLIVPMVAALSDPQIDTNPVASGDDVGDLYQRVASSRFVVVGKLVKSLGITKRMTPELVEKMKTSLDAAVGGALYVIHVDSVVCRQGDFQPDSKVSVAQPSTVRIFVPRDEAWFTDGQMKEGLISGRRYLLLLKTPGPEQVAKWTKTYQLQTNSEYYRTEQGSRGVVPMASGNLNELGGGEPLVFDKVSKLCQAVRPPTKSEKLKALKTLTESSDEVLQLEAQKAMAALEGQPINE